MARRAERTRRATSKTVSGKQGSAKPRDVGSGRPLLDKLGIAPGMRVAVLAIDDVAFRKELATRVSDVSESQPRKDSDVILLGATSAAQLSRLPALARSIRPAGAIWVVWPKGRPAFREDDIRARGLRVGLVDVKVVAFSETLSALKLVIPIARRR